MHSQVSGLRFLPARYESFFLVVLVCLFLMQRGGLLVWGYPHIAHPGFDETASGVLACDLLDGTLRAPLFTYQYEARSGDSLLEGLLLVPFFTLFGRSLFSLKLLALASALVTLVIWIAFIRRYHGIVAAVVFAALFAFPPVMFARLNLMGTIASHHLINPLLAAQLLIVFRIGERTAGARASWLWFCLGLLSGLGAYLFYTYIIFDLFCLLFLLIFFRQAVSFRCLLFGCAGLGAGFSPWMLRLLYSPGGGRYLALLLGDVHVEPWRFVQNLLFNLPHSLGYRYPARSMGIISPLFLVFLLIVSLIILKGFFDRWRMLPADSIQGRLRDIPPLHKAGLFVAGFPLFFLLCLSLSPMKIMPFEYWPTIGFFGNFGVGDVYRYRWLHPLFPFYFAIIASGIALIFSFFPYRRSYVASVLMLLTFFLIWGVARGCMLLDGHDSGRVFGYKGYSYDQMGSRFILRGGLQLNDEPMQRVISDYPAESRGHLYKSVGAKMALEAAQSLDKCRELGLFLQNMDSDYRNDLLWGIVGVAHSFDAERFKPVADLLAGAFPETYYTAWGFRHLGHVYYGLLLNREKVVSLLSPVERWFFRDYLQEVVLPGPDSRLLESRFKADLDAVPVAFRPAVCRGLGMLVGTEMLFDPACTPDYPLDSAFGERLPQGNSQEVFYQGVGEGISQTLARFLRTSLVSGDGAASPENRAVQRERDRCRTLMETVSSRHAAAIKAGFEMGMKGTGNSL